MEAVIFLSVAAGVVVSLGVLVRAVQTAWRFLRRASEIHDIVAGLPLWMSRVDESLLELHPDHGHSVKDRVDRTYGLLLDHLTDPGAHSKRLP